MGREWREYRPTHNLKWNLRSRSGFTLAPAGCYFGHRFIWPICYIPTSCPMISVTGDWFADFGLLLRHLVYISEKHCALTDKIMSRLYFAWNIGPQTTNKERDIYISFRSQQKQCFYWNIKDVAQESYATVTVSDHYKDTIKLIFIVNFRFVLFNIDWGSI